MPLKRNVLSVDIAITSYCNLHCPYCFANNMFNNSTIQNISLSTLNEIFRWLSPTLQQRNMRLGIIGGEPTLHPELETIIKKYQHTAKQYQNITDIILFTNGINLNPYIDLLKNFQVLININSPSYIPQQEYKKLIESLESIARRKQFTPNSYNHTIFTVGCNLYPELQNYSFFWDIINNYNIPAARFSVCAPSINNCKNKDEYYLSMKETVLCFISEGKKRNLLLIADCNQIPTCYYTESELNFLKQAQIFPELYFKICEPAINISPNFTASSCFGIGSGNNRNESREIDCKQFKNLEELEFYLTNKKIVPKILNNNSGKCKDCKDFELLKCQGGCLGFSFL